MTSKQKGCLASGAQPVGREPFCANPFITVTYQIVYISDIYIMMHNYSKITVVN